jgi:hypothetical protein
MKLCRCGSEGPFGVDRSRPDGLASRCLACKSAWTRRYRSDGPLPNGPKTCTCGSLGPFAKDSSKRTGLHSKCKACVSARTRAWVLRNTVRAKAAVRRWLAKNPDRMREHSLAFYARHPGARAASSARYRARHPETVRANRAQWAKAHPECGRMNAQRRRARHHLVISTLTKREWLSILELFGHACAYCLRTDRPLTQEHVIPISRGGPHIAQNVVPACLPCNSAKKNRPIWYMLRLS